MSGYIDYRLIINAWLLVLPLFILRFLLIKYFKNNNINDNKKVSKDKVLWDKYLVLESFYNYLQGLRIIDSRTLDEQGQEVPAISEENAQILYINVLVAQSNLQEQFTEETKKQFKEALFSYYQYVNIRFNIDKIEVLQDNNQHARNRARYKIASCEKLYSYY